MVTKLHAWVIPGLAVVIAVITLIPAEIWAHPAVDQEYRGFDRTLEYTAVDGTGSVVVTSAHVDMVSTAQGASIITLLTTPLRRVLVSVTATINQAEGAKEPLRIGLWSPLNATGYFVIFGPGPMNTITIEAISGGQTGKSLAGGNVIRQSTVGIYSLGKAYGIRMLADRAHRVISYDVLADGAPLGRDSVTSGDFPALFVPVRLSLTASSTSAGGTTDVTLGSYDLALLHERFWASKVTDWKEKLILLAIAVVASAIVAATAYRHRRRLLSAGCRVAGLRSALRRAPPGRGRAIGLVVLAVVVYLAGNAVLFQLGGHPFDMGGEKVFANVGGRYGPIDLYYLPNLVPLAPVWHGTPYIEAGFPYGPIFAYLFAGVGWVYGTGLVGPGISGYSGIPLEAAIKSVNLLFGLGDAALIYVILRRLAVPERWRLVATGLFLFNPAIWYSMSVWGQTHVISVFFVLAAIWLAESGFVGWAWLALIASCLTRPQMLVFALVLGMVLLRKFAWRSNVFALSWAVVITFLLLLPLTLTTSASLPVDILFSNFHIQEAGGNDPSVTTLSQGAYSIWPLVGYVSHGMTGLTRIYAESSIGFLGPLTYQRASQILTFGALALVVVTLARRPRESFDSGRYIPMVALGIMAFLMLLTGIVSSHFILALPLLILCWRWTGGLAYLFIVIAWSISTLVTMYGDMGLTLATRDYPLLAPANNAVTQFFVRLYAWDRFINVATVANTCALVWLAVLALRRVEAKPPAAPLQAV